MAGAVAHASRPKFLPNEKIGYIAHCCDGFRLHLADGRIETDKNNVEVLIRTVALNRNTALFAGDEGGAASLDVITSLIETGKLKCTKPHDWLKATHDAITGDLTNSRLTSSCARLRQICQAHIQGGPASDFQRLIEAVENKQDVPGVCAAVGVADHLEWSVGAYIGSASKEDDLHETVDVQL